ncbi:MAG: SUMF1/EgtB/PvdO family nonheme iron enzyme [Phycisphaerae bacterium]|nr:SUMF1/EgtB/PvdO family nonheme iron enzyme [Phycisphaerae bacterium]
MRTGLIAAILSTNALAQPDPSGIDFVTIGAPGNPAYSGPDSNNTATGRGSVPYEYRLGRTEVTSAQWLEFYNAFWGRAPHLSLPLRWGGTPTGNPETPFRLTNSGSGLWPAGGMTWRTSAMFVNWLNNDKRTDIAAVMNGAYDVSTFGFDDAGRFTDQQQRTPGARYWLPTYDEWMKGAYYDPNHGGTGIGGWWWNNTNGTNIDPVYGPPGIGQGNAGFDLPSEGHYRIPLMSYPTTVTPWGLLDVSGGVGEFTESVLHINNIFYREYYGSSWSRFGVRSDRIYTRSATQPHLHPINVGLRVASVVPAPHAFLVIAAGFAVLTYRRVRSVSVETRHEKYAVARAHRARAGPSRPCVGRR